MKGRQLLHGSRYAHTRAVCWVPPTIPREQLPCTSCLPSMAGLHVDSHPTVASGSGGTVEAALPPAPPPACLRVELAFTARHRPLPRRAARRGHEAGSAATPSATTGSVVATPRTRYRAAPLRPEDVMAQALQREDWPTSRPGIHFHRALPPRSLRSAGWGRPESIPGGRSQCTRAAAVIRTRA